MSDMGGFLAGFQHSLNQYINIQKAKKKRFEVGYFQGPLPQWLFISINGYYLVWRKK